MERLRRANEAAELPPLRRGGSMLRLKFARHPQGRRFLIVVEETAAPSGEERLSQREREVLEWLGQGKANSEIAIILGISKHTVKRHVEHVLEKLGRGKPFRRRARRPAANDAPPPVGPATYFAAALRH